MRITEAITVKYPEQLHWDIIFLSAVLLCALAHLLLSSYSNQRLLGGPLLSMWLFFSRRNPTHWVSRTRWGGENNLMLVFWVRCQWFTRRDRGWVISVTTNCERNCLGRSDSLFKNTCGNLSILSLCWHEILVYREIFSAIRVIKVF